MEDNNQSISEFIKKLKTIDIGELLEKAQTIKIEDLRSLKWKDIYNSRLFFPTIGILLAISSSIFILIPSNRKTTSIRIQSKLFLNETRELPSLQNNLSNSLLIKNELIKKTRELYSLVINKEILINIPRLLNDSAERANINVTEIRPISKDQVSCFYSEQQRENINPMRRNNNRSSINQNLFPELELNQDNFKNQSIPINHEKFIPSNKRLRGLFTLPVKDIDSLFSSNYYLLTLESSYLDSLDFIKNLQEYKVSILPVCFEPKGLISNSNSQLGNLSESRSDNNLNIRLIINVPTE